MSTPQHHEVLVLGGGTGGISVAARLAREPGSPRVTILEPNARHYYQPLWTLVGAGVFDREVTARDEADFIPAGAEWIRDSAVEIDPDKKQVRTAAGLLLEYEQLVVAPGMQLNWGAVEGLEGQVGNGGIVSNYSWDTVQSTWRQLQSTEGGNFVFTFPSTPIKCAGAPQKIMYLADDHLRRRGVRARSKVIYASSTAGIFGVKKYGDALRKIVERKEIDTHFRRDLVAIRPQSREAVFRHLDDQSELILRYDFIHVVPPQSAPDLIRHGPLADASGWVEVHRHTLQHVRYPDVWALGDASSLPCSRTGAAIRKQAPVLVHNLMAYRKGLSMTASYDGYASCPLVTGYGKLILAEFDYDGTPQETFPFDQSIERYSMYAMKAYALPELYWNGMLRGRA